jgi:cell division septum initiation protein DivIVA
MKKISIQFLIVAMMFAFACKSSGNEKMTDEKKEKTEKTTTAQNELKSIRKEAKEMAEKIENSTYAERQEIKDEVQDFVAETEETLDHWENEITGESELEEQTEKLIDDIENQTFKLEEELKEFGETTEDEWKEFTKSVGQQVDAIGNDLESLFTSDKEDQ